MSAEFFENHNCGEDDRGHAEHDCFCGDEFHDQSNYGYQNDDSFHDEADDDGTQGLLQLPAS